MPIEQRILREAFMLRYGDKGAYEAQALIGFLEAAGLALVPAATLRAVSGARMALNEAVTNGSWTGGPDFVGEWAISKEVYELVCEARDKLAALDNLENVT